MTFRDIQALLVRLLANAKSWSKEFRGAVKSGELRKQLKIWWRANRWFAILSLFVATILYFRIRENINYNGSRSIPVEVEVMGGDDPRSVAVEPGVINVFVRGSENDVRKFETSNLPIRLRISAEKVGNSPDGVTMAIKSRRDIPGLRELGLVATKLSAESVRVTYDLTADVEFFIDPPKHVGTPYHGEVKGIQFAPQSVKLRGGRKILNTLRERDAVRPQLPIIDVENQVASFTRQYQITLPEPLGKVAALASPTSVTVKVEIARAESSKNFENLPVRLSMPPGVVLPKGYRLVPLHVSADISGYDKSMEAFSNNMVTAYAYVPSVSTLDLSFGATNTLQVKVEVPHGMEIWDVRTKPEAVTLIMPPPPPPPPPPPQPAKTNVVAMATPAISQLPAATNVAAKASAAMSSQTVATGVATNATPVTPQRPAVVPQKTNSTFNAALTALTEAKRISEDKTETKDKVENGKPKEQQ